MSNVDNASFSIESRLVRRASERANGAYSDHAQVPDTIAERLYERLSLLKDTPRRVLDLGTGNGRHLAVLRKMYPRALVVGADISMAVLQSAQKKKFWQRPVPLVCLDASVGLPFKDGDFDLVISNLMLPWILPAEQFAQELNRILSDNGAFFLSSAGPDTLQELRYAWGQIDNAEHVNALLDMHDVGDLLHRAGISDPVMDAERIRVTYSSVDKLLEELLNTGCGGVLKGRRRGLMGADIKARLTKSYPSDQSKGDEISVTLEVVYAHGWKGQKKTTANASGEYVVNIDQLKMPRRAR